MKQTKKFDDTGMVTDSARPTLLQVRFTPEDESDTLTIFDSNIGPEYGQEKAYLDKDNPTIDFGSEGHLFVNGIYAFLPQGGSFYVSWYD